MSADRPPLSRRDVVEHLRAHDASPSSGPVRVGIEQEWHTYCVADPHRHLHSEEVLAAVAGAGPLPCGSTVTVEPGGQVELATAPASPWRGTLMGVRGRAGRPSGRLRDSHAPLLVWSREVPVTGQMEESVVAQHVAVHPFVRGLEPDDVAALQGAAQAVEFRSGDVIFPLGGEADSFYLIRTGVVALQLPDRSGVAQTIQSLAEGSALGWSWLFEPRRWQFTAVATTPVRAIVFDGAALREGFTMNPATGYRVLLRLAEVIAERLQATRRQLLSLSGN